MVSENNLVLDIIPMDDKIYDCRYFQYQGSIAQHKPDSTSTLKQMPARGWMVALTANDPDLLKSTSRKEVVERLERLADSWDGVADCGGMSKKDCDLACACRDNTYQLIDLVKQYDPY